MLEVVVGYVHGAQVSAQFLSSMVALAHGDRPRRFLAAPSGPNISEARNLICRQFLETEGAEWLLMVDTDMVFAVDAVRRLLAAADPAERPVVGALCYSQDEGGGDPHPTMYELAHEDGQPGFARYRIWPEDACFPVGATGAAFLLIHRNALRAVENMQGIGRAAPWFRESVAGNALIGEDMTFCLRLGLAGIPVHVHTGVQVGHMKPVMLGKVT